MTTRSRRSSQRGKKETSPTWRHVHSNRDLKLELRKRITAFFSSHTNRQKFQDTYNSYVTNSSTMSAQTLMKMATQQLNLKTVHAINVRYGTLPEKVTFQFL